MNGPDRRTPLDADEQALARVLRALPTGDPPSSLDAKILSMARDAVVAAPDQPDEATPRRRGPWLGRFGLAASVLVAAGLVWRLGGLEPSAPAPASVVPGLLESPPPAAPPADVAPASNAETTAPVAIAPFADAAPVVMDESAAPPPPPPAPPPPPPAAPSVAVTMAAPMAAAPMPAEATAERAARVAPVATDTPDAWIARIRDARDAGDLETARRDLQAFLDAHPGHPLPEDLAALRDGP